MLAGQVEPDPDDDIMDLSHSKVRRLVVAVVKFREAFCTATANHVVKGCLHLQSVASEYVRTVDTLLDMNYTEWGGDDFRSSLKIITKARP